MNAHVDDGALTTFNQHRGLVIYLEAQPAFAFVLHAKLGLIQSVYVVGNPDKLSRLPAAATAIH